MMQKNQRLRLRCERLGSELEGVCLNEGMPVFVPGVLPGEEADVLCVKVQPRYAFGRLMEVLVPSPDRVEPPCPVYDRCGGCSGHRPGRAARHGRARGRAPPSTGQRRSAAAP